MMEDEKRIRKCRVCGCTDEDCSACVELTGEACHWLGEDEDLCSACAGKHQSIDEQDDGDDGEDLSELDRWRFLEEQAGELKEAGGNFADAVVELTESMRESHGGTVARVECLEAVIETLEQRIERVAVLLAEHLEEYERETGSTKAREALCELEKGGQ